MKLQTLYLAYTDLTPGLRNSYSTITHQKVISVLRKHFFEWKHFFERHGSDFSIGFYISTKEKIECLTFYGPSISKKMKIVDYTMFLPEEIKDLGHYIDLIFEGFTFFLAKYNVPESTVSGMKDECKRELELV